MALSALATLLQSLWATARDVLPIALVVVLFQSLVLRRPLAQWPRVLLGFAYVLVGLALFVVGLEAALFPLGEAMARQLVSADFLGIDPAKNIVAWSAFGWTYVFAFTIAFSTTVAEPALLAVAIKAHDVSGGAIGVWALRVAVALGVAIGVTLGAFRIVVGIPLPYFILPGYALVILQTYFAPRQIVPLAYDSGGVTTSTVTVPIVTALGLGLADSLPGRNPLVDGFGLIAFASLFPMMTVMAYAQLAQWWTRRGNSSATPRQPSVVAVVRPN